MFCQFLLPNLKGISADPQTWRQPRTLDNCSPCTAVGKRGPLQNYRSQSENVAHGLESPIPTRPICNMHDRAALCYTSADLSYLSMKLSIEHSQVRTVRSEVSR